MGTFQISQLAAVAPHLIAAVLVFAFGAGILLYERFTPVSRRFFVLAATIAGWNASLAAFGATTDPVALEWWARVTASLQALTPPAAFAFAARMTSSPRQKWALPIGLAGAALAALALVHPGIARGVAALVRHDWAASPIALALGYLAFVIVVLAAAAFELYLGYRKANGVLERRGRLATLVAVILGSLAVVDYFYEGVILGVVRLSPVAIPAAFVMLAVAQVRYRAFADHSGFTPGHVLRAMSDAVLVCDETGHVRIVNPAASRLLGAPADSLVGRPISRLITADGTDPRGESFPGDGPVRETAMTLRPPRGSPIPVLVTAEPLHGFGAPRGRVVVARDIRDRLEAERALEATELRYRSLFWHNPAVAYEIAVDGTILHVNPAAEALFGMGSGELEGTNFMDVIVPEQVDPVRHIFNAVLSGAPQEYEVDVQAGGMPRRAIRGVSIPVFTEGRVTAVFGVGLDVTEETRIKKELEVQRRYFVELFDGSPEAIALISADGVVRRVNDEFCRLFGYSKEEAVGRELDDLIVPDHQRDSASRLGRMAAEGRLMRAELVRRRKDGERLDVSLLARRFQAPGEELQVYAIYRDVSEQRQTEKRLREREEELRHAQRMESVGKLAGGIAHDFNNLLTVINGHARFVLDELKPDAEIRADLEEIEKAGVRAAALTQQLLAFSRRQVMLPQALDINDVVGDMERMLTRLIGSHIRLETGLTATLPLVHADRGQLEQVVMNLVVNARDAMPGGGSVSIRTGAVHLEAGAPELESWAMAPGPYVLLEVEDTGVGMTPEVLERVFDPFFTTKEQGKGTGLGLATVFGIVKQSGGHVTARSEPGRGSRFGVYLPAAPGARRPESSDSPAEARGDGRPWSATILVVEDEPSVRSLATRILRRSGHQVLEAANGQDALLAAARSAEKVDLLLTDLVMPEMGGRELARQFRARYPDTPILFMSGYDDAVLAQGLDSDEFLAKPFTPRQLVDRVAAHLPHPRPDNR